MDEKKETSKIALLEAALFMTEKPLSIEELESILRTKREKIEEMLRDLGKRYQNNESGIELSSTGGYKLSVKPIYIQKVSKLTRHAEMSRGLLRILSIIAHHEPVTQSDLVKVIGNRVYEYTKQLEEMGFIRTEKLSRTKNIYTTRLFEEYFGVRARDLQGTKEKNVIKEISSNEAEEA